MIAEWNREVERSGKISQYDQVYHQFLWGSDPNEKYRPDVGFNRNHLLGMLVCRAAPVEHGGAPEDRMSLIATLPEDMTWKQLKDTFANLQFEWPAFINKVKNDGKRIDTVRQYVHMCMRRLGEFIGNSFPGEVLNDEGDTCPHGEERKLTQGAIRRLLAAVLLLQRHMDLYDLSDEVEPCGYNTGVTAYHHEASTEHFHKMCMHYYLPVAGKMQYKHDFPGMYNDVSQAVFFHDSQYKRKNREDHKTTNPIHLLSSVLLLYPEVQVKFEDDVLDPYEPGDWYWLLVPQRVYLVSPEPRVYYSSDLSALLRLYVGFMSL